MGVGHLFAFIVQLFNRQRQCAAGAAPADHQQVAVGIALDLLVGDVVGHPVDLLLTVVNHQGMVFGIGAERAVRTFFQTAHAVTQSLHAWEGPFAGKGLRIAAERTVVGIVRRGQTRRD